jgi:Protein of unknown function (DUF3574)
MPSRASSALLALGLAQSLALAGCSLGTEDVETTPPAECPRPLLPAHVVELFFGRSIAGGGEVSDADWQRFLDQVATPTFPDGLTALDAEGRYLEHTNGSAVAERSKLLIIVVMDMLGLDERVSRVIGQYKKRFNQESVLRLDREGCVAF